MISSRHRSADAAARLIDLAALVAALPVAQSILVHFVRPSAHYFTPLDAYWPGLIAVLLLWMAAAWFYRLNETGGLSFRRDVGRVARAITAVGLFVAALMFATKAVGLSRLLVGVYFVTAFLGLVGIRVLLRVIARFAGTTTARDRYYAVVGEGELAREIIDNIRSHPEWGMKLAGYVVEDGARPDADAVILGRLSELPRILEEHVLDDVVFAVPRERIQQIEPAVKVCEEQGVGAMISLDVLRFGYSQMSIDVMGSLPMLALSKSPTDTLALAVKRAFDILVGALVLLLLSPVLLGVALAIRIDSPGPILFKQKRVGLHGRIFNIWKFRSMYVDAEARLEALRAQNEMSGPVFKMKNDPRVTRVGRFIRRTSLDEFPQFWNVLVGDMSIVGPRPPIPSEVRQYKPWQRRRLSVRPGITCIWQISGRNAIDFDRWMELDLEYIDGWSLWGDISICLRTIPAVLGSRGAS